MFLVFLAIVPCVNANAGSGTVRLYANEDTYVSSLWPDETHDQLGLDVRSEKSFGDLINRIYLKFNLTGIDCDRIGGAKLFLYCYYGWPREAIKLDACQTTDYFRDTTVQWKDTGLTWNNAPDVGSKLATTPVGLLDNGGWRNWSSPLMSNYVRAECDSDHIASMVIMFTVEHCPYYCSRGRDFFSSEYNYDHPYLEITLGPTIESCDSSGARKDLFNLQETVYANGSGYSPSSTYSLYMVNDEVNWNDNMTIPNPIVTVQVTSDSNGRISPVAVWSNPLTPGAYDIIVDVNGNGKYDAGIDALDNNDIRVTAGLFVVPEYPLGAVLGFAGCLAALGVYRMSKGKHQKTAPKVQ